MEVITQNTTVGEFALTDYRTTKIFEKYGIDYRFEGVKTLREIGEELELDPIDLQKELEAILKQPRFENTDFNTWPLDLVMDYLVKKQHRYVIQSAPVIAFYLNKVCRVHGENHPELYSIRTIAFASSKALMSFHKKQEEQLFLLIKQLFWTKEKDETLPVNFRMDEVEKFLFEDRLFLQSERERHRKIQKLSHDYTNPPDGCTSYRIGLAHLKAFKEALDFEIHLKNNLLSFKTKRLINYYKKHGVKSL